MSATENLGLGPERKWKCGRCLKELEKRAEDVTQNNPINAQAK